MNKNKNRIDEYYKHYTSDVLFGPIGSGFSNVWRAIKTSAKDVFGAFQYTFRVLAAKDEKEIDQIKKRRKAQLNELSEKYADIWSNIVKSNPDVSTIAMLASPGSYFFAYSVLNGRSHLQELYTFAKGIGADEKTPGFSRLSSYLDGETVPGGRGREGEEERDYLMRQILKRDMVNVNMSLVQKELQTIRKELQKAFNFSMDGMSEGTSLVRMMIAEDSRAAAPDIESACLELIQSNEFRKASEEMSAEIIKGKTDELNSYIAAIQAPKRFIKNAQEATDIKGIKKAYDLLGSSSILSIEGLGPDHEKKVVDNVNVAYEKIKSDQSKIDNVLSIAAMKIDPKKQYNEQEKKQLVISALTKIQTIRDLEGVKQSIFSADVKNAIEEAKASFIESFKLGFDDKILSEMSKVDSSGKRIADFMNAGVEKIKNS